MKRKCPVCNEEIKGRSDKKYCSPACKNAEHYDRRKKEEVFPSKLVEKKIFKRNLGDVFSGECSEGTVFREGQWNKDIHDPRRRWQIWKFGFPLFERDDEL